MTVTKTQVQDLQTTIATDLAAGTWSLYGSTPQVHKESQKKSSKNTWIEVLNTAGNIIQAVNGAIIMFEDQVEVNINTQSREDLDNLYADFLNILIATSKGYVFPRTRDKPLRSKYNKNIIVKIKGI